MDELYTLDYPTLSSDPLNIVSPVQALIFLFKWTADREGDDVGEGGARGPKTGGVYDPEFAERGGFYAKQVRFHILVQLFHSPCHAFLTLAGLGCE